MRDSRGKPLPRAEHRAGFKNFGVVAILGAVCLILLAVFTGAKNTGATQHAGYVTAEVVRKQNMTNSSGYRLAVYVVIDGGDTIILETSSRKVGFQVGRTACLELRKRASGELTYQLAARENC